MVAFFSLTLILLHWTEEYGYSETKRGPNKERSKPAKQWKLMNVYICIIMMWTNSWIYGKLPPIHCIFNNNNHRHKKHENNFYLNWNVELSFALLAKFYLCVTSKQNVQISQQRTKSFFISFIFQPKYFYNWAKKYRWNERIILNHTLWKCVNSHDIQLINSWRFCRYIGYNNAHLLKHSCKTKSEETTITITLMPIISVLSLNTYSSFCRLAPLSPPLYSILIS